MPFRPRQMWAGSPSTSPPWPGSSCSSVRTRAGHTETISLLDAAIGALAISAAGAALAFGPIMNATGGSQLAIATNLSYPLGDLAVVAIMGGGLAMSGWRFARGWTVLMAGIALFAVSDTAYLFQIANGTYQRGIVDAGWVVSAAVIALAVRQPWKVTRVRVQAWSAFVFPATFGAIGLSVLVYATFRHVHLLALVLATACVVAVIGRMSLIFQQNLRMIRTSGIDASTDALTGLGNRRQLLADLAAAQETEATLVLLDLDGFKVYNDTYGHPAGDALLARLGHRLAATAGEGVAAYRLGGDEFCVLSHDCPPRPRTRPHRRPGTLRTRRRLRDHKLLRVRDDAHRSPRLPAKHSESQTSGCTPKNTDARARPAARAKTCSSAHSSSATPDSSTTSPTSQSSQSTSPASSTSPNTKSNGPPRSRAPRRRQSRNPRRHPPEEGPPH